jgi:hypothetical protein
MTENQPTLSYGEKIMGISFNSSNNSIYVAKIKQDCAEIADYLNDLRNDSTDPEVKRMASVAITELQTAQMWAVKAITWSN